MKLGMIRGIIEHMYQDRFDAYRYEPVLEDDGTTTQRLASSPFLADQPCRVSFVPNRQEDPKDSLQDATPVKTQPKIFAAPDCGLQVGDYVVARRLADDKSTVLATYTGPVGLPFLYPSHLECQIGEVRNA